VTDEAPDCSAQPSGALIVKCPASDRWVTNCVVSGISPGAAESTGAGFSVGEATGAAAVFPAFDVGAAGELPAAELPPGEDGAPAGCVAVFPQAARTAARAARAERARAARTRWAMFIAAATFVMAG